MLRRNEAPRAPSRVTRATLPPPASRDLCRAFLSGCSSRAAGLLRAGPGVGEDQAGGGGPPPGGGGAGAPVSLHAGPVCRAGIGMDPATCNPHACPPSAAPLLP